MHGNNDHLLFPYDDYDDQQNHDDCRGNNDIPGQKGVVQQRQQEQRIKQQQHILQQEVDSPVRGLEDKTTDGMRQRYWNQHPALRAVFQEQARQRHEGITDPHTLAQLYILFSQDSRREAKRKGKNDAAIAKSVMQLMTMSSSSSKNCNMINKQNNNFHAEEHEDIPPPPPLCAQEHEQGHHDHPKGEELCTSVTTTAIGSAILCDHA